MLLQLQQQTSDAVAKLQPAQAQERQHGQGFALQAPRLLQVADALVQPVRDFQVAAKQALPGVEAVLGALQDVLAQTEVRAMSRCLSTNSSVHAQLLHACFQQTAGDCFLQFSTHALLTQRLALAVYTFQ